MSGLGKRVLIGVALAAVVYMVMAGLWADIDKVGDAVRRFDWWIFLAALGLTFGNYLIRFVKWDYLLKRVGESVPTGESLVVFLASFLLTVTPGKIGEVFKSFLLKKSRGIAVSVTAPIVVAERLTDLIALLIIATVGIATYQYGATALVATAGLIVAGLLFLGYRPAVHAVIALVEKLPVVGRLAPKLHPA